MTASLRSCQEAPFSNDCLISQRPGQEPIVRLSIVAGLNHADDASEQQGIKEPTHKLHETLDS